MCCSSSRTAASATKWLNELVDTGVFRDLRIGRERLFINHAFLDILIRDEPDPGASETLF